MIAHELAHVVQQSSLGAGTPAIVQRQSAPGVHASSPANPKVSSDKWREDLEAQYRRAGYSEAANAVANCRNWGLCDHLLSLREAWDAYRAGRIEAKLRDPPESGSTQGPPGSHVAVAGLAAPVAPGGPGVAATESLLAKTALERASIQWGTRAAIMEGGAVAAEGTVAGSAAASAATVAVPVAMGVVLVLAVVDRVGWTRFQTRLQQLGYTVLPDPLGTCIGNCHRPASNQFPTSGPTMFSPTPGTLTTLRPSPCQPMSPGDIKVMEDWLSKSAPRPDLKTAPTTPTPPVARPDPDVDLHRRRRRGCACEAVPQQFGRYPCHAAFAASLSGTAREMRVITPEQDSADFDAINIARDPIEVKTGYRWLAFTHDQTLLQSTIARFHAQASNQLIIAARCGHRLRWYFNDPYAASFFGAENAPYPQYLRAPFPVPVWWVPFNCDGDSG